METKHINVMQNEKTYCKEVKKPQQEWLFKSQTQQPWHNMEADVQQVQVDETVLLVNGLCSLLD